MTKKLIHGYTPNHTPMSLKRYNVLLDEHEAEYLKKKGELSSNLRLLMEKYSISLSEGAKGEDSGIDKISKRLKTIESKLLKMDATISKFEAAYKRIHKYLSSQGLSL